MSGIALPIDADTSTGAPSFTGQDNRVAFSPLLAPVAGRPLGARSGIRPGNDPAVTVTAAQWTVGPFAGFADPGTALGVGPYLVAFTADETGTVNAADSANPRVDRLDVQVPDDPPGSEPRNAIIVYTAGQAAATPNAPAAPPRSFPLGTISVPAAGNGSPSFTASWPYVVASGGILPNDESTAGLYVGQYRDHPVSGLQRWDGSAWQSAAPRGFIGNTSSGTAVTLAATGTFYASDAAVTFTLPDQRRVKITGIARAKGSSGGRYEGSSCYNSGSTADPVNGSALAEPCDITSDSNSPWNSLNTVGTVVLAAGTYTAFMQLRRFAGAATDAVDNSYILVEDLGAA